MKEVQIKSNVLEMKVHTLKGPKYWNPYGDEVDVIVLEMDGKFYGDWFDPDYEGGILEELLFSEKEPENLVGWVGNSMEELIEKIDKDLKDN